MTTMVVILQIGTERFLPCSSGFGSTQHMIWEVALFEEFKDCRQGVILDIEVK